MPGAPEFLQTVGGGAGQPLATNASGTVQTDNYQVGGAFDHDGNNYPYTVNPVSFIQELTITNADDIDAEITTSSGIQFTLRLAGVVGTWDKWEIDSVTFRDPRSTGGRISGGWAGE